MIHIDFIIAYWPVFWALTSLVFLGVMLNADTTDSLGTKVLVSLFAGPSIALMGVGPVSAIIGIPIVIF